MTDDRVPEERKPEYTELIKMLHQAYGKPLRVSPERHAQALARAREHLGLTEPESPPVATLESSPNNFEDMRMNEEPEPHQHGFLRLVSLVAAVLVVGVLIVSSLLIFQVRHPTPDAGTTPAIVTGIVPDLRGLTYSDASAKAIQAGFKLQLSGTSTQGIVADQNPSANAHYKEGSPIVVTMTTRTTVPTYPPGATLVQVEQLIQAAHLQYQIKPDKNNPALPVNTVSRLDPGPGTPVQINTTVAIYVTNLNVTPGVSLSTMQISTTTLTFTTTAGTNPAPQTMTLTNSGGNSLTWTVGAPSQTWLTVTPTSGSDAADTTTPLTFSVDVMGLAAGSYSATVTITPSAGAAVMVRVNLTVN